MLLIMLVGVVSYGQEKEVYTRIKIITIDYKTKSFENDSIIKMLKVNDWVQFKIINLNNNLSAEATVNYSDRNLELQNSFSGYLSFDKNNEYLQGAKSDNKELKSIQEENKKNDLAANKITKDSLKNNSKNKMIAKETKLNINTMKEDLKIDIAEKFINKYKDADANAAKEDINWQKYLIRILKENIDNKMKFKDSLLVSQAKKYDSITHLKTKCFPPIKIQNYDFTEISIYIKDKTNGTVNNINVPFSNKNGFKLDFSTGFVFNGLQSKSYKILPSSTDYVNIKEEEKGVGFNTGIALLTHAYWRSANFTNFGLTTGLSFNLNNQNLNYMFGGSLLLGEDQRFIISSGITAGKVKELVKYYEIDKDISATELSVTSEVPTIDKLRATWFLSLTYNLGVSTGNKTIKL